MLFFGKKQIKKSKNKYCQQGSIILIVLMFFLMISIMGAAILEMCITEAKIADNVFHAEQASLAVEAGIEYARVLSYNTLVANSGIEQIPRYIINQAQKIILDETGEVFFILESPGILLVSENENSCIYKLSCRGQCQKAERKAQISIIFAFTNVYSDEGENKEFLFRELLTRGKILEYVPIEL